MIDPVIFKAAAIFDGKRLHENAAIWFSVDGFEKIGLSDQIADGERVIDVGSGIISPGFVDLQVNGGGGVMLNDNPSVEVVRTIAEAHWSLGVRQFLPTLITDTRETTQAVINAVSEAVKQKVPGVVGLHLEGPHLSVARKGAHDAAYIRPMEPEDLDVLLKAADDLPALLVTLAPENVSPDRVRVLSEAGVVVSIGHSDADFETCLAYADAGASCVTHLFNAMSQMGNREPGIVGAALASGALSAGLIADGIHVHPDVMRIAWKAKTTPGRIFLVSDAMAVAGTEETSFDLDGRKILRSDGKLTLEDGTLAGADLDLVTAVRTLVAKVGIPLEDALQAAITTTTELLFGETFQLAGKSKANFILIDENLRTANPLV